MRQNSNEPPRELFITKFFLNLTYSDISSSFSKYMTESKYRVFGKSKFSKYFITATILKITLPQKLLCYFENKSKAVYLKLKR